MPSLSASAHKLLKEEIQQTVTTNPIVVYSKTTCYFCEKTKELLEEMALSYKAIEVRMTVDLAGCPPKIGRDLTCKTSSVVVGLLFRACAHSCILVASEAGHST